MSVIFNRLNKRMLKLILLLSFFHANVTLGDLSFNEALKEIVEKSNERKKSALDVELEKQHVSEGKQKFLPNFSGKGALARRFDTENGYVTQQSAGINSELNLFHFGSDSANLRAKKLQEQIAAMRVMQTNLEAEYSGALSLLEYIELQREVSTIQRVVQLRNASIDLAKRQFGKGQRPMQDVQKLEVDKLGEEVKLQSYIFNVNNLRATISTLLHREIEIKPEWPWSLMQLSRLKFENRNVERLEKLILDAQISSLNEQIKQQGAEFLPRLDLNSNYGIAQDRTNDQFARNWTAAFVLTVPLYDRGRDTTLYRDFIYQRQKLELDLETLENRLKYSAQSATTNLVESLKAIQFSESATSKSEGLYNYTLQAFQKGVLSANDLSLEQHRTYESQLNANRAYGHAHRAFVKYCKSQNKSILETIDKHESSQNE